MIWEYEKFKGDMSIYAFCPMKNCGFHHAIGQLNIKTGEPEVNNIFNYCPVCGTYLRDEEPEINVRWNESDILELYGIERCEENVESNIDSK